MLLAIDIGNTETCFGVFDENDIALRLRSATEESRTADELASFLAERLRHSTIDPRKIVGAVVCSVVPKLNAVYREMLETEFGIKPLFVHQECLLNFSVDYPNPEQIGADRLANAAAVVELIGAPAVVVDFGTATTFDVIAGGEEPSYIGGAISPGVRISLEALFSRAARLSEVSLGEPGPVIGRSTGDGLRAGWIYGYAGLVDRIIGRIIGELEDRPTVIATGGLASLIVPHCSAVDGLDEDLTLQGLNHIFRLNS